ncbi:MAG TPA: MFS transporter, partial [Candidatus Limnocylindria bacterium]|nr:MFS transporter [Candidatus Limnocylindria bacterium]
MDALPAVPLFRQRSFSALWTGQLISILGERLTYLALLGLLAVHTDQFRLPNSSGLLTLLANVMLAPVLVFAPFTGAWLDRSNLKHVVIVSDLLRGLVVGLIPLAYATTHHTGPVFVLVFVLFTCNVFFLPAKSALTPEIVPGHQLLAANALLSAAGIAATAAGALAGGWVVDHWGWSTALWLNAATYLVSVVSLLLIEYRPHESRALQPEITLRGYLSEVGQGWALVRRSAAVGLGMLVLAAVWAGGGFLHVAGNLHIQRAASIPGMERVGVLLCVLGLGSGLGTWCVHGPGRTAPRPALLGGGLLLGALGLVAFAVSSRFAVFAAAAFVLGLSVAPAFVLCETLLQQGTELLQRGRVFSARDFVMRLVFMGAVAVAGVLTGAYGTRMAIIVCAGLL